MMKKSTRKWDDGLCLANALAAGWCVNVIIAVIHTAWRLTQLLLWLVSARPSWRAMKVEQFLCSVGLLTVTVILTAATSSIDSHIPKAADNTGISAIAEILELMAFLACVVFMLSIVFRFERFVFYGIIGGARTLDIVLGIFLIACHIVGLFEIPLAEKSKA